ncbi:hypothetical protein JXA47_11245 [Candidatus Sumerlaeota bacterium]|nr:hypothetical protein [Candidatus Sumerlaeota bacterium]
MSDAPVLERARTALARIIGEQDLADVDVSVLVKTLTPEEAIGSPGRRDFPIVIGRERVIEAKVLGARAHAFTDSPTEFVGKLGEILDLPLMSSRERAVFVATLNAVLRHVGRAGQTLHCRDDEPERCAEEICRHILERWGRVRVGLIGRNPAIAERMSQTFGAESIAITDLDEANVGKREFATEIWDGNAKTAELIRRSDLTLVTGTTLVNGTFDGIWECLQEDGRDYLVYGVTGAGVCQLLGLNRICPFGRDE